MASITSPPMNGGINNQKFALIGLIDTAIERNAGITIPPIVDFVPGVFEPKTLPFHDVFNLGLFRTLPFLETSPGVPEIVSEIAAFQRGAKVLHGIFRQDRRDTELACSILGHLQPNPDVLAAAAEVLGQGVDAVLQLRVEQDWVHYSLTRLAAAAAEGEFLSTDPKLVITRVLTAPEMASRRTVYVCIDERNLSFAFSDIRKWALDVFGVRLVLKSDVLVGNPALASNCLSSLIDFQVAITAEIFVGTSRSTFSNLVALQRRVFKMSPDFIYNHVTSIVERRDAGSQNDPLIAATAERREWIAWK